MSLHDAGLAVRRGDLLRYRQPFFARKLARAVKALEDGHAEMRRPYVAFSGGKDSLCALAIASRLRPHIEAIWSDDELEFTGQQSYVPWVAETLGATLTVCAGFARHGGWFDPWRDPPFWRGQLAGTVYVGELLETWAPRQGYDGTILGLRAEEKMHRRLYLCSRGTLHQVANGTWRCNPLAGWSVDDVWALIAGWELPYNPVYDRLAAIGVPREEQRVGPLPLAHGWHLRLGWPDMYRRLVERYGERWP